MTTISDLVAGLAQWLDDEGLADYKPTDPYVSNDRAVTIKSLPTNPDDALAIFPYGVTDARVLPNMEIRVQLRFRSAGSRLSVDQWADSVAEKLHWAHYLKFGDVTVQRAERTIIAPFGPDDNGREERADSYTFILL